MRKRIFLIVVGLAILAFAFTSCAGDKNLIKERDDLAASLEASRAKVSDLEAQLRTKDQEIADLEMQVQSKEEELMELEDELAMIEQEAEDLEIQIVSSQEEIAALEEEIAELEGSGVEGERISELRAETRQLENQVAVFRNELNAANAKNAQLNAEIAELNAELDELYEENDELIAELDRLESRSARDRERMDMTYDELVASLEEEIEEQQIEIERYRDALTINIMDQIFFDSGRAAIKKEGYSVLDRIGSILKEYDDKVIRIEGHADDRAIGPKIKNRYPSNWELGAARASAVARYFINKHGIDPQNLVAISYSFYRPLVPNTSEENRAKNRRIEIVLTNRSLYELIEIEESGM